MTASVTKLPQKSADARAQFAPKNLAALLQSAVGTPTGDILEMAGVAIPLYPLNTAEAVYAFGLLGEFGAIAVNMRTEGGGLDIGRVFDLLGTKGSETVGRIAKYLGRCVGMKMKPGERIGTADFGIYGVPVHELEFDPNDENLPAFLAWFQAMPAKEIFTSALPAISKATGIMDNPLAKATATAAAASLSPSTESEVSTQ